MGLANLETALEELMCRILGDTQTEKKVAKIDDGLYCESNSCDEQQLKTRFRLLIQI